MIDMVKRDVDARLAAMIGAERHRRRVFEEARRNPVCRVNLNQRVDFVHLPNGRIIKVIDGRMYFYR